jgi:hypothetical protein
MIFKPSGKSIENEPEVIIIDDNTDDEPKSMDPEERIVVDSLNDPLVPEHILAVNKYPVDTADKDPEKLRKEWTKNQETKREESEDKTKEFKEEMEFKAKTNFLENKEVPEPKRASFVETVDHDNGTIHRKQVVNEEDPVETVCQFHSC